MRRNEPRYIIVIISVLSAVITVWTMHYTGKTVYHLNCTRGISVTTNYRPTMADGSVTWFDTTTEHHHKLHFDETCTITKDTYYEE